jgi:hypothetical protein
MGLTRADFMALTPDEFGETWEMWSHLRTAEYRDGWERTRAAVWAAVAPYTKKKSGRDIMPLPWDNEIQNSKIQDSKLKNRDLKSLTKAEKVKRMRVLAEQWK